MKYPRPRTGELRRILESFPLPVRVLGEDGLVLFCNREDDFPEQVESLECTWQGKPARLEVGHDTAELRRQLEVQEERLARARKIQRRIARRMRRAEREADRATTRSARASQLLDELRERVRRAESRPGEPDPELAARLEEVERELAQARSQEPRDREVERLAYEDALTGLPNANILRRYLDFSLRNAQRHSRVCALLSLDVDEFRMVNETMGYDVGDELLCALASRLRVTLRDSDVVARKTGDQFLVLLAELPAEEAQDSVRLAVARIRESLLAPFSIQGHDFTLSVSMGVSLYPAGASTGQELIRNAEVAMERARGLGGDAVELYSQELDRHSRLKSTLESHLRGGVRGREFFPVYAPIAHTGTGRIVGFEALMRWNHRQAGVLAAREFLGTAEETGLIVPIGYQVVRQVLKQLAQWRHSGLQPLACVNLSGRQLLEPTLADRLARLVSEASLTPDCLVLEIKEDGAVRASRRWSLSLDRLEQAGFGLALDDFGSQASRLSTLGREGVVMAKLNPRLSGRLGRLAQVLPLGLGVSCVAKNVEDELELAALSELGFEFVQGHAVGQPLEAEQLEARLR